MLIGDSRQFISAVVLTAYCALFGVGSSNGAEVAGAARGERTIYYGGGTMPERVEELVDGRSDADFLANTPAGSVVVRNYDERSDRPKLAAALAKAPKCFGIGIAPGTALVRIGRELTVVGEGSVVIALSASTTRPGKQIRLREHMREDYIALRRAAEARAGEPFPKLEQARPSLPHGSLLIVGGGAMSKAMTDRFVELAGGKKAKIVVVPTASESAGVASDGDVAWLRKAGVKQIEAVHARTRTEANSPELLAKLQGSTGVWFGGGRQWRIVDAYEGTKIYDAFHDVLRRGGVIGGSSAGATIQGEYLVRGSPLVNTIMMAEGYERGFNFLPGTAIDQHFTQRGREPDMQSLKRTFPQLLGLGIDESTAVLVRGAEFEVLGANTVSVYPPTQSPADEEGPVAQRLQAGNRYDLKRFEIRRAN